jgi:arsenate reductase
MSELIIYHNPRCSKSRQALSILKESGADPRVVEYLKDVPDQAEMKEILAKLNLRPVDILRKGEQVFKEKFRHADFTDEEWIEVMREYPKLIERPIVIKGNKAVIGRPPEKVLDL